MPDRKSEEKKRVDIVLVEDDRFLHELLVDKLVREGFRVEAAYDGDSGLQLVKAVKPRLVLLDILLPGIDGFEFLAIIKKDEEVKHIPIIVLSNLGQREEVDRALSLGAGDYLVKANFAPDEILKKIEEVLKSAS